MCIIKELSYLCLINHLPMKVLELPGIEYFGCWEYMKEYLNKKGNPLFSVKGDLDLHGTDIKSLNNLISVVGDLDLFATNIESIDNLVSVGGNLNLSNTGIKSLDNLESVGDDLNLYRTRIQSLGNLKYVGGYLYLTKTPLSEKYSEEEIRKQVEVGGNIYL